VPTYFFEALMKKILSHGMSLETALLVLRVLQELLHLGAEVLAPADARGEQNGRNLELGAEDDLAQLHRRLAALTFAAALRSKANSSDQWVRWASCGAQRACARTNMYEVLSLVALR
jgi:hypothetical protein